MEPEETLNITRSILGSTLSMDGSDSLAGTPSALATMVGDPSSYESLECGMRLGDYLIERQLGAGGMGQVFEARGPGGKRVALKYLERAGARMLYRFKQEFRALAHVTHENLVQLGELVVLPDEATFFTMEIVKGVSFDEYVRGKTAAGRLPNLARLRRALRQLVVGVRHLHRNGCIHRDLKPSNVLVTPEGRVVILDFGLVQDNSTDSEGPDDQLMGTPAYMSPEQAGMEKAGPAADWYAVGVMLFECLSGRRPFRGSVTHVLFAKREHDPPNVDIPDAPAELVELCRRLLTRDPRQRPGGREILEVLGEVADESDADQSMASGRAPFVGRERELATLAQAFDDVQRSEAALTVHVRGPSGFGKSALVREFLNDLRERHAAVVLRGRCLERESVPYKGVDAIVDALSVHLRSVTEFERAELRPSIAGPLVRLFPVLGEIWTSDGAARTGGLDPNELRQRAFVALREVLGKLSARRPLALFVDDFHWGDIDSARLLTELVRPPAPPPLLLIVAFRDQVAEVEALRTLLAPEALSGRAIREVTIGPLAEPEARKLALELLGAEGKSKDPQALAAQAEAYARGAAGSPFFVGQLVRGQGSGDEAGGTSLAELDKIVARRILKLDPIARELLSVVAVAGGPVRRAVVIEACELGSATGREAIFDAALAPLLEGELVRTRGVDEGTLETIHDRIRQVTIGELEPDELVAVHRRLADAFELLGGDPESLAEHWERAGDRERAARYSERAANQASNSLAFQRAVDLYRKTLALLAVPADAEQPADRKARIDALELGLANQLINVGRGREAAQLLLGLAERAGDLGQAREFRRRGADQLIKTGYVDEGLVELDRLLQSVGLSLPQGQAGALGALVWEQSRVLLRGRKFTQRAAKDIDPAVLDRIDTCFAVVNGLSTQEILLSAIFHFRNLRYSLDAGEPYRVARALVYQCVVDVAARKWDNVDEQLTTARSLAAQFGDAQLSGFIDLCEASLHWFERRFTVSAQMHRKVIDTLEGVAGANWQRRTAQDHHFWTLVQQGRLDECRLLSRGYLERARERSDMQEVIEISAMFACALTYAGELDEAKRVLAEGRATWNPGRYLFGDVWAMYAECRLLLIEGKPLEALALTERTQAAMKKTFLDQHLLAKHNVLELRARSRVHAGLSGPSGHGRGHLRRAQRDAETMRKQGNPVLLAQAAVIEAAVASARDDRELARLRWQEAASLFRANQMDGYLAAVESRLAAIGEGEAGEALRARAQAWFERERIADPQRFIQLVAPAKT
ncbi:protein kinase domain-containing protein [Nannocystaceae bacterium ST9]